MQPYYEKKNYKLSQGKLYFTLEGNVNTRGPEYTWTLGKGVYGIFEDDELIYVGETMRSFEIRMNEHNKLMQKGDSCNLMYKYIQKKFKEKKFFMRPLVEVDVRVNANKKITRDEVCAMELGFITCFRPRFNRAGKDVWYRFPD